MFTTYPATTKKVDHAATMAQKVSASGMSGETSCPLCWYYSERTSGTPYTECAAKHKCLYGKLPWARLTSINKEEINEAVITEGSDISAYRKTATTKVVRIGGVPTVVQFVECLMNGYRCNQMCHYYQERIEKKRSILVCANSKGCNANGSFFVRLVFYNSLIQNLYLLSLLPKPTMEYTIPGVGLAVLESVGVYECQNLQPMFLVNCHDYYNPELTQRLYIRNRIEGSEYYDLCLTESCTWTIGTEYEGLFSVHVLARDSMLGIWLCYHGIPRSVME